MTREELEQRAHLFGIDFNPKIGDSKLEERIAEFEATLPKDEAAKVRKTGKLFGNINTEEGGDANMVNVWIKLTNLNPDEREMQTAYSSIGNATDNLFMARYVPFNKAWAVPWCLVKDLQSRTMTVHSEGIDGQTGKKTKMRAVQVAKYSVEILNKAYLGD